MTRLLIGGYSGDKGEGTGITVLDGDQIVATVPAHSPSWLARHPFLPVLYAVEETDEGKVRAWRLEDGAPAEPLGTGDTGGAEPAHLTVDPTGRFLITANYTGGSISVHELQPDGSIGPQTDLVQHQVHGEHPRQDTAHPHMIQALPDGVIVADLGADAIYRYTLSAAGKLSLSGVIATPPGSGPRHVLAVGDRYYVTAELSGQVLVYDSGQQLAGAVAASSAPGPNQPSELVSDGRYLYVANRGPNTVSVFDIAAGSGPSGSGVSPGGAVSPQAGTEGPLRYLTEVPVGTWPRHIALDEEILYVANERSHEVMCMLIDPETGIPALSLTVEVPSPTHVLP
jgi:6-phosphogluconolactonase (cycloisomerase 2 family)